LAVSESEIAHLAANLKGAEDKLGKVGHQQYTPSSPTALHEARVRRNECLTSFERTYTQYCTEMERAHQTPKETSYWVH
jgi:hypothetical protein